VERAGVVFVCWGVEEEEGEGEEEGLWGRGRRAGAAGTGLRGVGDWGSGEGRAGWECDGVGETDSLLLLTLLSIALW
jgi:hypothetical protein